MEAATAAAAAAMMKILVITGEEKFEVKQAPIPDLQAGKVLVKVKAVATCPQWDKRIYHGKAMFAHDPDIVFPYMPGQPGHEMTGTIAAVGKGVMMTVGLSVCAWRDPGQANPGCYAEYVVMDEADLIEVPEHLHYTQVVSLELAMCVAVTILRLKQTVGIKEKKCVVNGLGPAGLIALQMLLAEGASEVVGVDQAASRRELALALGASEVCEGGSTAVVEMHQLSALEIAIDCAGYPAAVRYKMERTNAAVALFAVQREDYLIHHAHSGLNAAGYPGHYREAAAYALILIVSGKLDLRPLITKELPLEAYGEGVRLLQRQEAIKICFVP